MAGEDVRIVRATRVEPVCELVDQCIRHTTSVVYRADTSIRPLRPRPAAALHDDSPRG
jgi:hypothetical protein